jgi:hypothetical protein
MFCKYHTGKLAGVNNKPVDKRGELTHSIVDEGITI